MNINADDIFKQMVDAAEGAFGEGWDAVKGYAPVEFKKMAIQLAEIAENVALYEADSSQGFSPETGKALFAMQRNACEGVLVAVSQLTIIAVQKAINAVLKIIKDTFFAAIGAVL